MRFQVAGSLAILWMLAAAPATPADDATPPAQVDFSVLTPSMEGHFCVSNNSGLAYLPYVGGFTNVGDGAKSKRLRRLVEANRYDPLRTIADRVIDALAEAGYVAAHEPIPRPPPGSVQSLSWSDLPEHPKGKQFLDLNIHWICLSSSDNFFKYRPAISIGWRLLGPRREVVEPTRNLVYVHAPPRESNRDRADRSAKARHAESPYPPVEVSESCAFDDMDDAEKNPLRLWGCFGEAYDVAVERLVIDLKQLRPPATTVTASGDSPSGTSTR